jgi:hypothetical protein
LKLERAVHANVKHKSIEKMITPISRCIIHNFHERWKWLWVSLICSTLQTFSLTFQSITLFFYFSKLIKNNWHFSYNKYIDLKYIFPSKVLAVLRQAHWIAFYIGTLWTKIHEVHIIKINWIKYPKSKSYYIYEHVLLEVLNSRSCALCWVTLLLLLLLLLLRI